MKRWSILMVVEVPDEVDAEHVESGTREAMAELDFWRIRALSVIEVKPTEAEEAGHA